MTASYTTPRDTTLPGGPVQDVDYRWTQAQSASNAAILEPAAET